MNNEITTTESNGVNPCRKCGAVDRYKSGRCRPCQKERSLKHYEDNRDIKISYQLKWIKTNVEKVRGFNRKYREANRDKLAERNRKWLVANSEKRKTHHHNRRAKIKGNGGKLSPDIIQTLMALQKGKCACCSKSLKQGHHLDHIMPIALGGTNTDDNVQLLTPKCNLRKSDKHPDDWARLNGRLF